MFYLGPETKKLYGFSVLEILVVLAITALLLAIVPPMLPNVIDSTQVKAAVRELSSALKYARSQAISSQDEVALKLDVDKKTYSIQARQRQLSLPDDAKLILTTASSEQISDNEGTIRFFADGSSTGGGVRFKDRQQEYLIDVNWLTGKVTIN